MNYTNVEQSKKLVELGIDRYTCDLVYKKEKYRNDYNIILPMTSDGLLHNLNYFGERPDDIPCWSTGALIDLLPKTIIDKDDDHEYNLFIDMVSEMPYYIFCNDCFLSDFPNDFLGGDLISNLIKCIEWLKENKYL